MPSGLPQKFYYVKAIGVAQGERNHLSGTNLAYTDGRVKWQRTFENADNQASATIYNVKVNALSGSFCSARLGQNCR